MNRRRNLCFLGNFQNALLLTLFVHFCGSIASAETVSNSELPGINVLMIAIDDLNDWVGCLQGHPQAYTPNIDRLAAKGTLFTTAHCQGPICGPSRTSLMSGLYPHTTGVYQQPKGKLLAEDKKHFRGKLLPEYFAKHGYKTMGVGKLTHGYPEQIAFQEYGGWKSGYGPKPKNNKRFNYHLPESPYSGTQTDWGAFPDLDEKMPDHQSAEWAVGKLKEKHDKPFFLAVGMVRPHVPFYVPEKWFERFPLDEIQLPEVREEDQNDVPLISVAMHAVPKYPKLNWLRKNNDEQFKKCVQAYLASITFMDHQVGKVLDALEKSEYANKTIIVLFSDHGYHIGEKDRVAKHSLWEEATRVPLIISLPEQDFAQTSSLPVGLIDIYPTLVHLCGLPKKNSNEGASLFPILFAQDTSNWREAILTTYAKGNHALRTEHLRLIRYEDGSYEMYDHRFDPQEFNNLAGPAQLNRVAMKRNWEIARTLSGMLPEQEAPYHPATSPSPINEWFEEHYDKHGVGVSDKSNQ